MWAHTCVTVVEHLWWCVFRTCSHVCLCVTVYVCGVPSSFWGDRPRTLVCPSPAGGIYALTQTANSPTEFLPIRPPPLSWALEWAP